MIINFIGNYQSGYVGEVADETHLTRELEELGHKVNKVPRDIWKGYVDGGTPNPDWVLPTKADINIICKWPHFNKKEYVEKLREVSSAPVFYWTWDYMGWDTLSQPDWHTAICEACDLHLTNEGGDIYKMINMGVKATYFPFDVSDRYFDRQNKNKVYTVTFFGSYIPKGDRIEYLTSLKNYIPLKIFSWNWMEWRKLGFDAQPAVYGNDFASEVSKSKIVLGFSVEPNCWGYWSNRVGKVLTVGGFLLYQYAPGMELFIGNGAEYFSSISEMKEKIDHYLIADVERDVISERGYKLGRRYFTSKRRIEDLIILIERYLKHE